MFPGFWICLYLIFDAFNHHFWGYQNRTRNGPSIAQKTLFSANKSWKTQLLKKMTLRGWRARNANRKKGLVFYSTPWEPRNPHPIYNLEPSWTSPFGSYLNFSFFVIYCRAEKGNMKENNYINANTQKNLTLRLLWLLASDNNEILYFSKSLNFYVYVYFALWIR